MGQKILFVSNLGGIGGGERFLLNHMRRLLGSGYIPMIAIGSPGTLNERCREEGIPVYRLNFDNDKSIRGRLASLNVISQIIRVIQENKISILHINDIEIGKYAAIAAKLTGIPVVWTCHGWWCSGAFRELFCRLFVDRTIAVSDYVRQAIVRRGILSREETIVIHPGIDCTNFSPRNRDMELARAFELSPDDIVIAIVGRFQRIKGHTTFLKAAHEIVRKVPGAVFLIVGENVFGVEDDEINFREIGRIVGQDPLLQKSVKFIPFQKDMPRLFSMIDILVSASESETFGMVHLEAMACGRPVVGTNVGGPVELVKDGETGYLFTPGDFSSLAEKIVLLCQKGELRKRLGEMGRKRAMKNFAIEKQTGKYCRMVYDTLGAGK